MKIGVLFYVRKIQPISVIFSPFSRANQLQLTVHHGPYYPLPRYAAPLQQRRETATIRLRHKRQHSGFFVDKLVFFLCFIAPTSKTNASIRRFIIAFLSPFGAQTRSPADEIDYPPFL